MLSHQFIIDGPPDGQNLLSLMDQLTSADRPNSSEIHGSTDVGSDWFSRQCSGRLARLSTKLSKLCLDFMGAASEIIQNIFWPFRNIVRIVRNTFQTPFRTVQWCIPLNPQGTWLFEAGLMACRICEVSLTLQGPEGLSQGLTVCRGLHKRFLLPDFGCSTLINPPLAL